MEEEFDFEKLRQDLRQSRDEIQLKIHLASLDIKEEWNDAQIKLENLELKMEQLSNEAKDAGEELLGTIKSIGAEIDAAFKRIKNKF